MGPNLAEALLIVTGMRQGRTQKPCYKLRTPRSLMSPRMHQLHQNGINVASVRNPGAGAEVPTLAKESGQQPVSEQRAPRRRRKQP